MAASATFAVTIEGYTPSAVVKRLADLHIFMWLGPFYAVEAIAILGLAQSGGLIRVGLCHHTTRAEVDQFVDVSGATTTEILVGPQHEVDRSVGDHR